MVTLPKRPTAGLFLATDRCDRCDSRAQVRAVLTSGELLLCGHHDRKHHAALESIALWFEHNPNPA